MSRISIWEKVDREMAAIEGVSYEEYMAEKKRNKGRIDLRKAEVVEDGQVYYIDEYEEKFGKKA